jgi:hypothetical protein
LEEAGDEPISLRPVESPQGRKGISLVVLDGTASLKQHVDPLASFFISRPAPKGIVHKPLGVVEHAQGPIIIHSLPLFRRRLAPAVSDCIPPEVLCQQIFQEE